MNLRGIRDLLMLGLCSSMIALNLLFPVHDFLFIFPQWVAYPFWVSGIGFNLFDFWVVQTKVSMAKPE